MLRLSQHVLSLPRYERLEGRRIMKRIKSRLYHEEKVKMRQEWTVKQAVDDIERQIRGESLSSIARTQNARPMGAAQQYVRPRPPPSSVLGRPLHLPCPPYAENRLH